MNKEEQKYLKKNFTEIKIEVSQSSERAKSKGLTAQEQ